MRGGGGDAAIMRRYGGHRCDGAVGLRSPSGVTMRGSRRQRIFSLIAEGSRAAAVAAFAVAAALPRESIRLPPGFGIEVVARVPNARAMTWGARGTLFVGSARAGNVYAVTL